MAPSSSPSSSSSSSSHSVSTADSSCPDLSAALHEAIHTNPPMFSSPGFAGSSRHPRQQHIPDYTRSGTAGTPPPYIVDETAPLRPLGDSDHEGETRRGWREVVRPWVQAVLLLLAGLAAATVAVLFVVFIICCVKAWVG